MTKEKNNITTPPAQLWIGNQSHLVDKTKETIQRLFCTNNGCKKCITCNQIEKQQHHGSIWIKPEKQYTLDQLDVIFKTISFKLDKNKKLFFILQNADFLSSACSNSLLKSVEEPPEGYHFIFLAERINQILPTIQSRCTIKHFYSEKEKNIQNKITNTFKSNTRCSASQFLKLLHEEKPNEKDTVEILDQLLSYWIEKSIDAIKKNNNNEYNYAKKRVEHIKIAIKKPPMPGSSKIFWRNFYLQFMT